MGRSSPEAGTTLSLCDSVVNRVRRSYLSSILPWAWRSGHHKSSFRVTRPFLFHNLVTLLSNLLIKTFTKSFYHHEKFLSDSDHGLFGFSTILFQPSMDVLWHRNKHGHLSVNKKRRVQWCIASWDRRQLTTTHTSCPSLDGTGFKGASATIPYPQRC